MDSVLREPLHERLHFRELDPDWLYFKLGETLPSAWPIGDGYGLPEAIRTRREGDFFHQFDIVIVEVWDLGRREFYPAVVRDEQGNVVEDTAAALSILAERLPAGGWEVKVLCYQSFAGQHFHRLVGLLREVGGVGEAHSLAASGPKGGRPRGTDPDVRWRAQLFKQIRDEHLEWTSGRIASHAWANYEADLMAHGFMQAPTRHDVTNDLRDEKWRE